MPILFFWRRDAYEQDGVEPGQPLRLHQRNPAIHQIELGESLWAFTRNRSGAYVLAAEMNVQQKGPSPDSPYGPLFVSGPARYFDIERSANVEPLIRALSIPVDAKVLGHSFQGRGAVRQISEVDSEELRRFADQQPSLGRKGQTDELGSVPEPRQPNWSRDELILALDLYFRHRTAPPGKESREILELSDLLHRMAGHRPGSSRRPFRNPAGIFMKLMNFRHLDPEYTADGRVGLTKVGSLTRSVWEEFSGDLDRIRHSASAIIGALESQGGIDLDAYDPEAEDDTTEAPEGKLLTREHRTRERSRKLVDAKKKRALTDRGALLCEGCGFDFESTYGIQYIECHHTKPLAAHEPHEKTNLNDLALLCSNCHRAIHAHKPWLTLNELRSLIIQRRVK